MSQRIYQISGRFKSFLFVFAVLIVLILLVFTNTLVNSLRTESRQILEFYAQFYARAAQDASGAELNFIFDEIIKRTDFPIILSDPDGKPTIWKGIGLDPTDYSDENFRKVRSLMLAMNREIDPIPIRYGDFLLGNLYYGDSKSIQKLQWLPFIEIFGFGLFIVIGFLGFRSIRRSEAQFIWVGMAKETAHQLGTPISSLMGWIELMRSRKPEPEQDRILQDMEQDIKRLDKVAVRFSQIGSRGALHEHDLGQTIDSVVHYFKRRLPQSSKSVTIKFENALDAPVAFNPDLLEWVLENLIKNALDAIDGPDGKIRIAASHSENRGRQAMIEVSDTGRGMSSQTRKNLFKPGYSTKKRGWGLGLSLAKRIVEEYHGGRLQVSDAAPGKGSTFLIEI